MKNRNVSLKSSIDKEKIEFDANYDINLHENEEKCLDEEKSIPAKKYRVNLKNIERIKKVENKQEEIGKVENTQVIVISRKRQRENLSEINSNEDEGLNPYLDNKSAKSKFNPLKKIKVDDTSEKEIEKSLSYNLNNLSISFDTLNNPNVEAKTGNLVKDRNMKIFSNTDQCKICNITDHKNEKSNIFKNYYPTTMTDDYIEKLKEDTVDKSLKQSAECRQLKFFEKRNLIDRRILNNEFGGEIKNIYTKLYGDCKIIKNNKDKIVIVNKKPLSEEEIEQMIQTQSLNLNKNEEMSFFVMFLDKSKSFSDDQIMEQVTDYEMKNNLVLDDQRSEDSENNPEDYDSNREENSCNSYPDEEESENNEENEENDYEDDEYELYNTNKNYGKPDYIKKAEKKLNKEYINFEEKMI